MDTSKRHLTFPQPPPTRARCPRSLPRLVTPTAWAGQNCCDVGGETPATPTVTVGGPDDGADRGLSNHVVTFSTFLSAGSTVLRVTRTGNHPSPTTAAKILLTEIGDGSTPLPVSIWAVKSGCAAGNERDKSSLFCVYRTHEEACEALCSSTATLHFNFSPALDADLQPFAKLQLVHVERRPSDSPLSPKSPFSLEMNSPVISLPPPSRFPLLPDLVASMQRESGTFVLSSNPPNPKANFRFGDWICPSVSCVAHNFGRNSSCIGCGIGRPTVGSSVVQQQGRIPPPQRFSPRFANIESPQQVNVSLAGPVTHLPVHPSQGSKNPLPIQLTPSGTQICVGGKVQNVSNNPLAPCYIFWSYNEPFPEQGQIRPALSVALQHPPILNTGNRGPIEHQPGDWICKKCNYLNWRRRKVCQTCYPYADGNGDSISATVQAERIALLANTIQGREFHSLPPSPSPAVHERPLRRSSLPLQALTTAQQPTGEARRHDDRHSLALSRSRSYQADWFLKPHQPSPGTRSPGSENPKTLYQTSFGNGSSPSFAPGTAANSPAHANTSPSGPLLPSFLQDIVQSPSLSPASSADFSLEDYSNDEAELGRFPKYNEGGANAPYHGPRLHSSLALKSTTSLTNMFNIWKLDGDETKGW